MITQNPTIDNCRQDFPVLEDRCNGHRLAFLDTTASSQKPKQVIQAMSDFYLHSYANVHRGAYDLSQRATDFYEEARSKVQTFIGAKKAREIIYTRNTTESLNLIATSWAMNNIRAGEAIITSVMEHHSNFLPWQRVAQLTGAKLLIIDINDDGTLNIDEYEEFLKNNKVKFVALSHISNVLGTINPVKQLSELAHKYGAVISIDGAQSAPHIPIDVIDLDCDFYSISGHKMLGPTGIGALYGKYEILKNTEPYQLGGSMMEWVDRDSATWAKVPQKFEAGTPNIGGAVGMGYAIDYLNALGMDNVFQHEIDLTKYAFKVINELPFLKVHGNAPNRIGTISFELEGAHPHDIASILNSEGVAVRAGHHCCQLLMKRLGIDSSTRASLYIYNNKEDVDQFIAAVYKVKEIFK